jgi:hypothetical protein
MDPQEITVAGITEDELEANEQIPLPQHQVQIPVVDEKREKKMLNLKKARDQRAQNQANKRELEVLRAQLSVREGGPVITVPEPKPKAQVQIVQREEINYAFVIEQCMKRLTSIKKAPPPVPVRQQETDMSSMFNFS